MKKRLVVLMVGVFALAGSAFATPVYFDIGSSSITTWVNHVAIGIMDTTPIINSNLDTITFTLNDNESSLPFLFFSIRGSGIGISGFDAEVTLNFDYPDEDPALEAKFTIDMASYYTVFNCNLVYDILWEDNTQDFTLADGNLVRITLQEYCSPTSDGIPIPPFSDIPIHATITNFGIPETTVPDGPAIPEPTSLLLLGTGLGALVLVAYHRRKK